MLGMEHTTCTQHYYSRIVNMYDNINQHGINIYNNINQHGIVNVYNNINQHGIINTYNGMNQQGQGYSSTVSLTSSLDEGGWSTPRLGRFTPRTDPVRFVWEAGWAPERVRKGEENLALTEIRSKDPPPSSESLYRLSYPDPIYSHVCLIFSIAFMYVCFISFNM